MRLEDCKEISDEGFIEAVRKLPELEEVNISKCCNLSKDSLEVLGRSCPLLKSLQFTRELYMFIPPAETMSNISHLDINGNMLTNIGLLAILDGCPLLESLNIEDCYNLDLNESLKKRCLDQIKDVRLPNMDASNRYYYDDNNYSHFDYQDLYDEYLFGYD
jgi:F-box/leucine-rich repeat protein 2/20